jgi:hypothetical protein
MENDCEFKARCGGGHTTAQHHLHVYERALREACGEKAYKAIADAVDKAAREGER